jgi:hypothetical protein
VSENRGWENVGLGVSSDEQVSMTVGPSCNIGSRETSGEGRRGLMGKVNGGFLVRLRVRRGDDDNGVREGSGEIKEVLAPVICITQPWRRPTRITARRTQPKAMHTIAGY